MVMLVQLVDLELKHVQEHQQDKLILALTVSIKMDQIVYHVKEMLKNVPQLQ